MFKSKWNRSQKYHIAFLLRCISLVFLIVFRVRIRWQTRSISHQAMPNWFCVCVDVQKPFFDAFKIWAAMKWHEIHLDIDISIYKQIKRQRSSVFSRSVLLKRFLLYYWKPLFSCENKNMAWKEKREKKCAKKTIVIYSTLHRLYCDNIEKQKIWLLKKFHSLWIYKRMCEHLFPLFLLHSIHVWCTLIIFFLPFISISNVSPYFPNSKRQTKQFYADAYMNVLLAHLCWLHQN